MTPLASKNETYEIPMLVSIDDFISNHHTPINIRWAIQKHQQEMKREKVIVRFGKRILIHPENFWKWLFEREEKAKK